MPLDLRLREVNQIEEGRPGQLQSLSDMRLTNMWLLSLSLTAPGSSVRITHLLLPSILPSSSSSSSSSSNSSQTVTLDCHYAFTAEERDSLVVEWFLNNQHTPFYR